MIFSKKYKPLGFYVYAYLRHDNTPYYIGKGYAGRAWTKGKYEIHPPTNLSKIIIVEHCLTEIGALALERFLIRWYGRKDLGTGILRNMTEGGDGVSGRKVTKETIEKSLATKRKTGGIFKCATPEARAKATQTRLKNNNGVYNAQTSETIAKGLETKRTNNKPKKPRIIINGRRSWKITSPVNQCYETTNLADFCRLHNLSPDTLRFNTGKRVTLHRSSIPTNAETLNSLGWMLERVMP